MYVVPVIEGGTRIGRSSAEQRSRRDRPGPRDGVDARGSQGIASRRASLRSRSRSRSSVRARPIPIAFDIIAPDRPAPGDRQRQPGGPRGHPRALACRRLRSLTLAVAGRCGLAAARPAPILDWRRTIGLVAGSPVGGLAARWPALLVGGAPRAASLRRGPRWSDLVTRLGRDLRVDAWRARSSRRRSTSCSPRFCSAVSWPCCSSRCTPAAPTRAAAARSIAAPVRLRSAGGAARRRRRRGRGSDSVHTALPARHGRAIHARPAPLLAAAVERRHGRPAGRAGRCARHGLWRRRPAPSCRALCRGACGGAGTGTPSRSAAGSLPLVAWNASRAARCRRADAAAGRARRHGGRGALRSADPGALPPGLAGVPPDAADARARRAGARVLSRRCSICAWQAKTRARRDALRARRRSTSGRRSRRCCRRACSRSISSRDSPTSVGAAPRPPGSDAVTDRAFQVWQATGAGHATRHVVGRALRTRRHARQPLRLQPARRSQRSRRTSRRARLHVGRRSRRCRRSSPTSAACCTPGRALCVGDPAATRIVGSIVVHAVLDYENLPFISSQTPVRASCCARPTRCARQACRAATSSSPSTAGAARRSTRRAGTAWPLDDAVVRAGRAVARAGLGAPAARRTALRRLPAERSRRHLRARLSQSSPPLGHLVNLAELTVLAAAHLPAAALRQRRLRASPPTTTRRPCAAARGPRQLLSQAVPRLRRRGRSCPVVALALVTRNYVADEMRVERRAGGGRAPPPRHSASSRTWSRRERAAAGRRHRRQPDGVGAAG